MRFAQSRCVPGCSAAVHPSRRHQLDLASRRLSPYRSRASARRKLPGIRELHTIIRYRPQSQADHNSFTASELSSKPVATWRPRCDSATADKVRRNDSDYQPIRGRPSPKLEFPPGTALHGTSKSCARATSRRSRHAWRPNGTILLLASCPMSARPNQGIPDLRHQ